MCMHRTKYQHDHWWCEWCECFHGYSSCSVRSISSDEICPWNECSSCPVHWVVVALALQRKDGNIAQLEDFSVDQLGRQFIYKYDMHIQSWQNFLCSGKNDLLLKLTSLSSDNLSNCTSWYWGTRSCVYVMWCVCACVHTFDLWIWDKGRVSVVANFMQSYIIMLHCLQNGSSQTIVCDFL